MNKKLPQMDVHSFVRSLTKNRHLRDNFLNYSIDKSYENVDHNFDTRFYLEDFITTTNKLPTFYFMHHLRRILRMNKNIISFNVCRKVNRVIIDIVHI